MPSDDRNLPGRIYPAHSGGHVLVLARIVHFSVPATVHFRWVGQSTVHKLDEPTYRREVARRLGAPLSRAKAVGLVPGLVGVVARYKARL